MFKELTEENWYTLFSNRRLNVKFLKIPPYQRLYVWDELKISNLLQNIIKSKNETLQHYFLGSVVLCREENDSGTCLIVDGQQRLTTLTIIVSTIRFIAIESRFDKIILKCNEFIESRINHVDLDELKYKLCIPNVDNVNYGSEFRRYIQKSNSNTRLNMNGIFELKNFVNNENKNSLSQYVARLHKNFMTAYDILYQLNEIELDSIFNFIELKCRFIIMISNNFLDAHRIFCTLNITGTPLSPLDLYRAKFYGHLVKEKGAYEANRLIDSKLKIWNRIYASLGYDEMKKLLTHANRLKLVEKQEINEFLLSCKSNDDDLIKFFSMNSANIENCDRFLDEIMDIFDAWQKIQHMESMASTEALKLLRGNHWDIWITIALAAIVYSNAELTKSFWVKLERFMSLMVVLISNRLTTVDMQAEELLSRCFDIIRNIIGIKAISYEVDFCDLETIVERLKGDIHMGLSDFAIKYVLLRICLEIKLQKNYTIESTNFDFIYKIGSSNDIPMLNPFIGHIGNLMLVYIEDTNLLQNKSWNERKLVTGNFKFYPISMNAFEFDEWSFDAFKSTHNKYVQMLGKMFELKELENFQFDEIKFVVRLENNNPNQEVNISVEKTSFKRKRDEYLGTRLIKRLKSKDDGFNYVSENALDWAAVRLLSLPQNDISDEAIIDACLSIDPDKTGFIEPSAMLELLLKLQKKYKKYSRKWQSTFSKWIDSVTDEIHGCNYIDFFKIFKLN